MSFCHADGFLFLCRKIKTFLRFTTLFLHCALLSSHTPVPSFLAHLSLSSAYVGCPGYLMFLPPVMLVLLSPSCLLEAMIASRTPFLAIPFLSLQTHYLISPPWKLLSSYIAFDFQVFMSNLPFLFQIFSVL